MTSSDIFIVELYTYMHRYEGKIQLHTLESEGVVPEDRESKIFPESGQNDVISCMALTADFLVYGTDMGGIVYFLLEDWATLTKFKHITGEHKNNTYIAQS
jgi:WD repeat-containing protein 19